MVATLGNRVPERVVEVDLEKRNRMHFALEITVECTQQHLVQEFYVPTVELHEMVHLPDDALDVVCWITP
jgi:hypothetical protein